MQIKVKQVASKGVKIKVEGEKVFRFKDIKSLTADERTNLALTALFGQSVRTDARAATIRCEDKKATDIVIPTYEDAWEFARALDDISGRASKIATELQCLVMEAAESE